MHEVMHLSVNWLGRT